MRQQRYAEAIAAYESMPPQAFRESGAYTGWVTSLWREGRLDEAKQNAQRWLQLARTEENTEQEAWAQNVLMRVAEEEGRPEDALAHGQETLRLAPDSDAHMHLVRVLRGMGRYAEAKGHLEAYLEHGENPILREEAERVLPDVARLAAEQAGMVPPSGTDAGAQP
jgi:tetratricopeptide (TPR) repeat protein